MGWKWALTAAEVHVPAAQPSTFPAPPQADFSGAQKGKNQVEVDCFPSSFPSKQGNLPKKTPPTPVGGAIM